MQSLGDLAKLDEPEFKLRAEGTDAAELLAVLRRATALWYDQKQWRQVQRNAMRQDFSWQHSANLYHQLYISPLKT